ncbi:MAG: hypothetical protein Q8R82_12180 [Hyphomonadaceae bacterium]|nr:hypothetical protein [Hyphomonadaceae bacterium]
MPASANDKAASVATETRGPRGKKPPPLTNEQAAVIGALASLPARARKILPLTPKQVSALLGGRAPTTMRKDRSDQRAAIEGGRKVDPGHPMSLPYVPPVGSEREVQYLAQDVLDYLERRAKLVDRSFLKRGSADPTMRGLQSWMSLASPSETWPFVIQEDGRPLDMAEAIATGRLTEHAQRLNLREFCDRLAEAASRSGTRTERAELERRTPRARAPEPKREERWKKPGGPI